jgi:two-component sensor histidine kinase
MEANYPSQSHVDRLLKQQKALATFGNFAFRQVTLQPVLDEAARICAACLDVSFSKICQYRPTEGDLLIVAGNGWSEGVVGGGISVANETSPQGRAFKTGEPQICPNLGEAKSYTLPAFYHEHKIVSTVDVIVAAKEGPPFGILEVDSQEAKEFDEHDIDFLTGFANVLAEAVATTTRAESLRTTLVRMAELVEEKEILSQELKHRVRNSLHLVYALLTSELNHPHDEQSTTAFRSIATRVMGLAEVFDHLLGTGMTRTINFGDYVAALCQNLPALYKDPHIQLTCTVEPVLLELDKATALGIVVTELVSNAYLHAFSGSAGKIDVTLTVVADQASLLIGDNGVGFTEVETKRRGIGLVKRLVRQVGGTLRRPEKQGSTWLIDLPIIPSLAA